MQQAWLVLTSTRNAGCSGGPPPGTHGSASAQRSEWGHLPRATAATPTNAGSWKLKSEQDRMPSAFGNAQSCGEGADL